MFIKLLCWWLIPLRVQRREGVCIYWSVVLSGSRMDFGQAWPLLSQWGAAASGAALGQFVRERPQHCHCDCDCRGDPSLGAALAKQLEHCGPAPPPLPVELRPSPSWGLFLLGVVRGVAFTLAVLVAVALDLVRRGAVRFEGQPPAPPPQAANASGPLQAEPAVTPAGAGVGVAAPPTAAPGATGGGKGGKKGGKGMVVVASSDGL